MRQSQKGMTLIEVMVTLVLSSICLTILFSFYATSSKMVRHMVGKRDVESQYTMLRTFVMEEIGESETVCVKAFKTPERKLSDTIDLTHDTHTSLERTPYFGEILPLQSIVCDVGKLDEKGNKLERKLFFLKDGDVYEVQYQDKEVLNEARDQGVSHLIRCDVQTDGIYFYLLLAFQDAWGATYEKTIYLPLNDKQEGL